MWCGDVVALNGSVRGPPELILEMASESQGTPEAQVHPPASTAPARIEQGPRKRRRVANKLYTDSQYDLQSATATVRSRGRRFSGDSKVVARGWRARAMSIAIP